MRKLPRGWTHSGHTPRASGLTSAIAARRPDYQSGAKNTPPERRRLVDAMGNERVRAVTSTRQLRKPVREVAKCSPAQSCHDHKSCHSNAGTRIEAVQQDHETGDCRRRNG